MCGGCAVRYAMELELRFILFRIVSSGGREGETYTGTNIPVSGKDVGSLY